MPTLADYDGDAVLISTPRGKNWFLQSGPEGKRAAKEQRSWKAPTKR